MQLRYRYLDVAKDLFRLTTVDGSGTDGEVLYIARKRGHHVVTVPVGTDPAARATLPLRDAPAMARDLLVIRWSAIRGRYS